MITRAPPGQLVVRPDAADAAREAAERIAGALRGAGAARGRATIALSGGNTPRDAYAALAREPNLDWGTVWVFWVDERAVPPTDERSNYRWAKATLLDGAGLAPERVHRMRAESPDRDVAARDYERAIREGVEPDAEGVPAFDVLILGVGEDGHTASLFPGERLVDISDRLVAAVPARGAREGRLTLTPPAIEHARNVFVLAVGAGKRAALGRVWAVEGDVHDTPARLIRGCRGAVTWIVDAAAGDCTDGSSPGDRTMGKPHIGY
jgi:6-phosphogluconolactonase